MNWLRRFMYGRYGIDELSKFLLICWFGLAALNIFFRISVLYFISLIPAVFFFFRVLSKDAGKRKLENTTYLAILNKVTAFFKLTFDRFRYIRTHRFVKCKKCRATLRVPRKTGKHALVCPRCKERFEVNILL